MTKNVPTITAIDPNGSVIGWRYLWLKYVSGFQPGVHCATCLVGPYSKRVTRTGMPTNMAFRLDECTGHQYIYLCGVASHGGWSSNLHLAVEPAPGETAEVTASTGTVFRITNARQLVIPALRLGIAGRPLSFTTCRNWQFGVEYYGQRAKLEASAPRAPRLGLLAN